MNTEAEKTETKKYVLPYLILGAILTGFTLVLPQVGFLEWVTMIPLFIGAYRLGGMRQYRLGKTYLYGFLTVFAFYFIIYHWFTYLYPLDFAGLDNTASAVVIIAGWVGLSLLQAIPGGLIFLCFKLLHKTELFRRLPILRPFVIAALWIVFEWSSTLSWVGVPWGRLCLGQAYYLPMLQSASLLGSYFISFLILAVNGLLAYAILYRKHRRRSAVCASVAAGLVLVNLVGGLILQAVKLPASDTVRVGVVQGNINSHDKWSSNSFEISTEIYGSLTRKAAAEGAKIILWPETAFPYTLNMNSSLQSFVSELARECRVTIIAGALYSGRNEEGEWQECNALYQINPDGSIEEGFYAKRHLVPFGEYVPMRELVTTLIPPLSDISMLQDDLTPGTDPALFETEWGKLGSLICFDSIYEGLTLDSVRTGAELMLLSSNDSWFYDSAAIYQHERQAQLRAIETGRYLVRAGNTGISTVISDKGEHLAWIDALERGYLTADVEMHDTPTLYTIIGNTFVYLCIAYLGVSTFFGVYWRKKQKIEDVTA